MTYLKGGEGHLWKSKSFLERETGLYENIGEMKCVTMFGCGAHTSSLKREG